MDTKKSSSLNSTNQKISILFVQHTTEVSGSLVSLFELIQGLQEQQQQQDSAETTYDIDILCKDASIAEWYKQKGMAAHHCRAIGFLGHCSGCTYRFSHPSEILSLGKQLVLLPYFVWRQYQFLRQHPCHIVHLNSSVLLSSAIAARWAGKKVLWHIREVLSPGTWGVRKKLLQKTIMALAHKVVAISPWEAQHLVGLGENVDPAKAKVKAKAKVQVVYNSLDFTQLNPHRFSTIDKEHLRKKWNIPRTAHVVLSLGGVNMIKGAKEMIAALTLTQNKNIHLLMAGHCDFPPLDFRPRWRERKKFAYLNQVQQLLSQTPDLQQRIHWVGPHQNLAEILAAADLLYFGGTIPHFPRPVYEAWAMEKPVIAFNIDGVKQNVAHGQDGYLVDKIEALPLAQGLDYLFSHPEQMQQMGQMGQKKAWERFFRETNVKKMKEIYAELLK